MTFCFCLLFFSLLSLSLDGQRLRLERLRVEVICGLALVEVSDELVNRQHVQVLGYKVEEQPVAHLLPVAQARWVQDCLHIRPLGGLSCPVKNKKILEAI